MYSWGADMQDAAREPVIASSLRGAGGLLARPQALSKEGIQAPLLAAVLALPYKGLSGLLLGGAFFLVPEKALLVLKSSACQACQTQDLGLAWLDA